MVSAETVTRPLGTYSPLSGRLGAAYFSFLFLLFAYSLHCDKTPYGISSSRVLFLCLLSFFFGASVATVSVPYHRRFITGRGCERRHRGRLCRHLWTAASVVITVPCGGHALLVCNACNAWNATFSTHRLGGTCRVRPWPLSRLPR